MKPREAVGCLSVSITHLQADEVAGVEDFDGLFLILTRVDSKDLEGLSQVMFAESGALSTEEKGLNHLMNLSTFHVYIV